MLNNKGLVTEFEERELGTNPGFKKPRVIGEKVGKQQGQIRSFTGGEGQERALK